jgi:hypothetical protein
MASPNGVCPSGSIRCGTQANIPLAGFEVAQRDYAHHYVAIGKARGYRPFPP